MPDQEDDVIELFLHKAPYKILRAIKDPLTDNYVRAISAKADTTRSHAAKIVKKLEKHDIVDIEKKGRRKNATLTEKGENAARHSLKFVQSLKNDPSEPGEAF